MALGVVTRTFGELRWDDETRTWHLFAEPHVIMRAKRLFPRAYPGMKGEIRLKDAPDVATDLMWLMLRWKLRVAGAAYAYLVARHEAHQQAGEAVQRILSGDYTHTELMEPARKARDYQLDEVEILLATGSNLVVHAAGLGKTATALYPLGDPRCRPALFVTLTHLPTQVVEQLALTYPDLNAHILRPGDIYDPKNKNKGVEPDLIVTSYSKLAKWGNHLAGQVKYVVYDEIQELRTGEGTGKYNAARHIRDKADYCMGTTASPVYGYGGEMWNIVQVTDPGFLGTHGEFVREWGGIFVGAGANVRLQEAGALGAHLRAEGVMSIKSRKDVGREIPDPIIMREEVACQQEVLAKAERDVRAIAADYLAGGQLGIERMQMANQLDMKLRWATGVGKAHAVADFVTMLLESEERILLFGWHRDVYDIWQDRLKQFGTTMYTGSESPAAKAISKKRFLEGDARVMMMSLRAGAGIDGLQEVCSCVVFGELDWSPGVHRQNVWRIDRDGQDQPVAVYYCVSEGGTDPLMEETIELKAQQAGQIVDPDAQMFGITPTDEGRIARLAQQIVSR